MRNEPSSSEAVNEMISLVTRHLRVFGARLAPTTQQLVHAVLQATVAGGGIIGPTTQHASSDWIPVIPLITVPLVVVWCHRFNILSTIQGAMQRVLHDLATDQMSPTAAGGDNANRSILDVEDSREAFYYAIYHDDEVLASIEHEVHEDVVSGDDEMVDFADVVVAAIIKDIISDE
jgi:hypothetical protein